MTSIATEARSVIVADERIRKSLESCKMFTDKVLENIVAWPEKNKPVFADAEIADQYGEALFDGNYHVRVLKNSSGEVIGHEAFRGVENTQQRISDSLAIAQMTDRKYLDAVIAYPADYTSPAFSSQVFAVCYGMAIHGEGKFHLRQVKNPRGQVVGYGVGKKSPRKDA